jgi:undecaprenyl-diphosphatase
MAWNVAVFLAINHLAAHAAWADRIVAAFALWGGPVLLVVIVGIAWWRHRGRPSAVADSVAVVLTGVAAVVALGINGLVAMLWFEPRPFVTLSGVTTLLSHSLDDSFPSDHAAIGGALAVGVLLFARRWGLVAIVVAVLLAVARVYAGMHYPLDVLAGLAIGAIAALLVVGLLTRPVAALVHQHASRRLLLLIGAGEGI